MTEFQDYATIMWPSRWPENQVEAHCTMIHLTDDNQNVDYTAEDVLNVLDTFLWPDRRIVATGGLEYFGPENDIPVVTLINAGLQMDRELVKLALMGVGITFTETYSEYRPHITVADPEIEIPSLVTLLAPQLWWGDLHYKLPGH